MLTIKEPDVMIKVIGPARAVVADVLLDAAMAIEAELRLRRAAAPATRYLTDRRSA